VDDPDEMIFWERFRPTRKLTSDHATAMPLPPAKGRARSESWSNDRA
jgi:hypothetical protein